MNDQNLELPVCPLPLKSNGMKAILLENNPQDAQQDRLTCSIFQYEIWIQLIIIRIYSTFTSLKPSEIGFCAACHVFLFKRVMHAIVQSLFRIVKQI